jgi:prophage DNA circulation protein
MGLEFGEGPREMHILVSGDKEKLMAMVYTHGSMETDMKDSLRTVSSMVRVLKNSQMGILTKVTTKMVSHLAMVNITGPLEAFSKAILKMGYEMETDFGNEALVILTNMRESMLTIEKKVKECLLGQMEAFTKEHM